MIRRFPSFLCALSLLALAGVANADTFNIALLSALGSNALDNDVIAKIKASAPFLNITVIKVDQITPDVATLEGFQAVMIASNNPFANGVLLGDNLRQYIDDGHSLVIANNANTSTPCGFASLYQLCGGFQSGDYWAVEPGQVIGGNHLTLGTIYVPNSPLLAGVTSFDGGSISNHTNGAVNGSATRVADWSDGFPLIVTRTFASGSREVELNFYPPSADGWPGLWMPTTDGGRLMANALTYAGNISGDTAGSDVPEPNYLIAGAGLALVSIVLRKRR